MTQQRPCHPERSRGIYYALNVDEACAMKIWCMPSGIKKGRPEGLPFKTTFKKARLHQEFEV